MISKRTIFLSLFILLFSACNKENIDQVNFDRDAMLTNYADNIIIPRYEKLALNCELLHQASLSFQSNANASELESLKEFFEQTYLSWQACSSTDFGPAGVQTLKAVFNIYPVDTSQINNNISNSNYNLDAVNNQAAIGLPALDFLLFGKGETTESLSYFNNNTNAITYLVDVCAQLNTKANIVSSDWSNQYRSVFVNANGIDIGSSLGMLVNEFNLDFERFIRDGKVGIPLGIRSLGNPQLNKTEAFFSGYSIILLKESIDKLEDLYTGTSLNGSDGLGLDDYLNASNASHSGTSLNEVILDQFMEIRNNINQLNQSVDYSITQDPESVNIIFNSMQELVVYLKIDLPSTLGVLISYQDNDGD